MAHIQRKKRQPRLRVRTGCLWCKQTHLKCDERKPVCTRCQKRDLACVYASATSLELCSKPGRLPSWGKLTDREAPYLDHYQSVLSHELAAQMFSVPEFWQRTVLRDAVRDEVVLDAVVAVGALSRAVKSRALGDMLAYYQHYSASLKHYSRALGRYRSLLAAETTASLATRKVLIITMLITVFETMQGNWAGIDALTAKALGVLKGVLMRAGDSVDSQSSISATLDDEGVQDAEFYLVRQRVIANILTPTSHVPMSQRTMALLRAPTIPLPPGPHLGVATLQRAYMRLITTVALCFNRLSLLVAAGAPFEDDPQLQVSRAHILARSKVYINVLRSRLEASRRRRDFDEAAQLMKFYLGALTVYIATSKCVDFRGSSAVEDPLVDHTILQTRELRQHPKIETTAHEGLCFSAINLLRDCRNDAALRSRLLSLCRDLATPGLSWELKTALMSYAAVAQAEEACRDENGYLPPELYHDWVAERWDEGHTTLRVTIVTRGSQRRQQLVLRPADFGYV